jgi:hypothetical protein
VTAVGETLDTRLRDLAAVYGLLRNAAAHPGQRFCHVFDAGSLGLVRERVEREGFRFVGPGPSDAPGAVSVVYGGTGS